MLAAARLATQQPAAADAPVERHLATAARPADPAHRVESARPGQQAAVLTPGGRLCVGVREVDPAAREPAARGLLRVSEDGGVTFTTLLELPGTPLRAPVLAADPERERVYVAWESAEHGSSAVWFATADVETGALDAEPTLVEAPAPGEAPYLVEDLAVCTHGTVALAVTAHRRPPHPWRPWSAALFVRAPGADRFGEMVPINLGSSGVAPDLELRDDVVDITYRTIGDGSAFGIYLRSYDLRSGRFLQDRDVPVRLADGDAQPANTSVTCVDGGGNRYVLYAMAAPHDSGVNRLELAFLPATTQVSTGTPDWERQGVAADRALRGGNENPRHFALTRGPGDHVIALYSLVHEAHARLYARTFAQGEPFGEPRILAEGPPGAFTLVAGVTDPRLLGLVLGAASGFDRARPGGRVVLAGRRWPLPVRILRAR